MKSTLIAALFALCCLSQAYAITAGEACKRIIDRSVERECLQTVRGGHFHPAAVAACDRIKDAFLTIECLATVRDRYFMTDAIAICDSYNGASATIECLNVVADSEFSYYDLNDCDSYTYADSTTMCLRAARVPAFGFGDEFCSIDPFDDSAFTCEGSPASYDETFNWEEPIFADPISEDPFLCDPMVDDCGNPTDVIGTEPCNSMVEECDAPLFIEEEPVVVPSTEEAPCNPQVEECGPGMIETSPAPHYNEEPSFESTPVVVTEPGACGTMTASSSAASLAFMALSLLALVTLRRRNA